MINKKTRKKNNKKARKNKEEKKIIFFQNVPLKTEEMKDDETHEEVEAENN